MWRIKKFIGDSEFVLSAEVTLTATKSEKVWNKPPISIDF